MHGNNSSKMLKYVEIKRKFEGFSTETCILTVLFISKKILLKAFHFSILNYYNLFWIIIIR